MNEAALPPLRIGSHVAPVIPDVLQEHLEEVAFLSIQRRKLLFSPEIPLRRFLPHEERITAHWEGLSLGGEASVQIALGRLQSFDPWETYAAARVWLEFGEPEPEDVLIRLEESEEEQLPAWREALRRLGGDRLGQVLPPDSVSGASWKARSVLAFAWGWHGLLPEELASGLAFSSHPSERWSIARVLGAGAAPAQMRKLLPALFTDPEADVRKAALWSLALLDSPSAVRAARKDLASAEPDPFSARVLGLLGTAEDGVPLASLLEDSRTGPACARALGDLGYLAAMDDLLDSLSGEEALAAAARDAIETMLGSLPTPSEDSGEKEDQDVGKAAPDEKGIPKEGGPGQPPAEAEEGTDPAQIRAGWVEAAPGYDQSLRWLRGQPFPWQGPREEEPMEAVWRASLFSARGDVPWLRAEVPDGFFTASPLPESVPGE